MPVGRSSVVDVVDRGEGVVHCPEGRSSTLPGSNQLPSLSPSLLRSGVASPEADPALGTFRIARECVSAVRSFSPTAGNFAVRPTARPTKHRLPHATTAIIERERARAPRNSTGGRRARRRCLPRRAHTHALTYLPLARRQRRGGGRDRQSCRTDRRTDGGPMLSYPLKSISHCCPKEYSEINPTRYESQVLHVQRPYRHLFVKASIE